MACSHYLPFFLSQEISRPGNVKMYISVFNIYVITAAIQSMKMLIVAPLLKDFSLLSFLKVCWFLTQCNFKRCVELFKAFNINAFLSEKGFKINIKIILVRYRGRCLACLFWFISVLSSKMCPCSNLFFNIGKLSFSSEMAVFVFASAELGFTDWMVRVLEKQRQ